MKLKSLHYRVLKSLGELAFSSKEAEDYATSPCGAWFSYRDIWHGLSLNTFSGPSIGAMYNAIEDLENLGYLYTLDIEDYKTNKSKMHANLTAVGLSILGDSKVKNAGPSLVEKLIFKATYRLAGTTG